MGREVPGVVAVLCIVPSGVLVLHIEITSSIFPPWTEMSKKKKMTMKGNEKNYSFFYYTALHFVDNFYCNVSSIVHLVENMVIT